MGLIRRMVGPSPGEMVANVLEREEPEPLEGTRMDLFNSIIPNWYADQTSLMPSKDLAAKVWVANRCVHLNAQQISTMPITVAGDIDDPPDWVSSPDPAWYPNGIADAVFAIVSQLYGWGFSCQYITDVDSDGYPRRWTVLPSADVQIRGVDGRREYRLGDTLLEADRIVQIDRDPSARALHGTPALTAYAQNAWGLLAAGNQSMTVNQGGIPSAVLKPQKKITKEQAETLQLQWANATTARNGLPPVLPPDLDFEVLSFDPSELALLETQEFNARAIATAFGVPAMLINMPVTGGLTYQNPAMLGEMWWRFELRPLSTRIANAWSEQMLPAGQFVTFDAKDTILPLDAGDDEDLGLLVSRLGLGVQYGIISADEARKKLIAAGLELDGSVSEDTTASPAPGGRLTAIGGGA
jgi:hypothetical protein